MTEAFGYFSILRRRWCTNTGYCTATRALAAQASRKAGMARDSKTTPVITLTEAQRQLAMERFAVLQPHREQGNRILSCSGEYRQ